MSTGRHQEGIPIVAIDSDGVFKYILIEVKTDKGVFNIVRGFAWAEFHDDMYQPASSEIEEMGFETECTGGGRIRHDAAGKKIKVYGYSQAFGRGDHQVPRS